MDHLDDETPITSLPCQWKVPKKRKESTLPIAQVKFEKHAYGKPKTRQYDLLEDNTEVLLKITYQHCWIKYVAKVYAYTCYMMKATKTVA